MAKISRLMAFSLPATAVLLGVVVYQYGYVGLKSDLSALEDLRAAKSETLERHIRMISQKPQMEEALASLKEAEKATRSNIIDAPTPASAAAVLQNAVKGMIAARGGTISCEQVDKPEPAGKFVLVGAGFDAVLPDIRALSDTLLAVETHTPYFVIRDLDVRTKNYREPKELIVRLRVAALAVGK